MRLAAGSSADAPPPTSSLTTPHRCRSAMEHTCAPALCPMSDTRASSPPNPRAFSRVKPTASETSRHICNEQFTGQLKGGAIKC
jgi:hypothetical protein